MNIALIGYGKMGKEIEKIILDEGHHTVVLKISEDNPEDFTIDNLKKADVAIEFTQPHAALNNVLKCFEANLPVVVGTTSWQEGLEKAKKIALETSQSLFVSPNYSIGVNLFFELNKKLYDMMHSYDEYAMKMIEIHHTEKKDAPSGTAIKLAQDLIDLKSKFNQWELNQASSNDSIQIDALREEHVPGTHIVAYSNDIDSIEIKHTAKSRRGFAMGAVRAAEFLVGKKGFYTMRDLLNLNE